MILVAVGGVKEYKFTRLFKILEELIDEGTIDGSSLFVQTGFNKVVSKKYTHFDFLDNSSFKKMAQEADFIISHGGVGNVLSLIKQHKKVIVFPRLSEYGEHIDNHQLDLCRFVSENEYALVATNKEELISAIGKIKDFNPREYVESENNLEKLIIRFIEGEKI